MHRYQLVGGAVDERDLRAAYRLQKFRGRNLVADQKFRHEGDFFVRKPLEAKIWREQNQSRRIPLRGLLCGDAASDRVADHRELSWRMLL